MTTVWKNAVCTMLMSNWLKIRSLSAYFRYASESNLPETSRRFWMRTESIRLKFFFSVAGSCSKTDCAISRRAWSTKKSSEGSSAVKTWETHFHSKDYSSNAILCIFIPATTSASPRTGTRLARPDPRRPLESTPGWVPAKAGGVSGIGIQPLSPMTLCQIN